MVTEPEDRPPVDTAPTWRRQPYRIFFALGFVHVWVGLFPWLLIAWGGADRNARVFHSIAQIQGFMICFALGFLFTMIPRRTRTVAPSPVEMGLGILCPIGITTCAAFEELAWSQTFWFVLVALLTAFILRRFRGAASGHGPLPGFVWLPIGFTMGLVGSVLFGAYGALGEDYFQVHELAQLFLLQGLFLSLVVGVGSMVFPLFTRGESPGAVDRSAKQRWLHGFAALGLVGTFFLEVYGSLSWGYVARGLLVLLLLVCAGGIHRRPTKPGLNRLLVWGAAWMIPIGLLVAGALPAYHFQAGLHLVFISGFALMAFAVAAHVSLAHGGRKDVLDGWPLLVVVYAAGFLVAATARVLMQLDGARYPLWLGVAAGSFLFGTLAWAALVFPVLARRSGA